MAKLKTQLSDPETKKQKGNVEISKLY